MTKLAATLWLALAPLVGAGATPSQADPAATEPATSAAAPAHDLHVSYGAAAVEGDALTVRIRFFRDDLTDAMVRATGNAGFTLRAEPAVDAQVLTYLRAHFAVSVEGQALEATLVGSGEDELDREPVWWYAIQFKAPADLTDFQVTNTLLLELFDDQTNIVKFVHFPDQEQKTYSFGRGEERFRIRF